MKDYSWQRYWYKRGDNPQITNGFLWVWGKYENAAFSFDKFSQIPCLVLLGEPGMGKSIEIKRIFDNCQEENALKHYLNLSSVPDTTHLYRKLFDLEKLKAWKNGQSNLYLFLDSLDEALLNIDTLSGILADEIGELPTERLFLRVACRSAEWSNLSKFESRLKDLWREDKFQTLNLAPLQQKDVIEAAKAEEQDGNKFLTEVFEKNVSPLAAKPIGLKLLLGIFKEKAELPSNQTELYTRGCLDLCDEDDEDRPAAKKDKLNAEQRFRIAARIAALMIFSNKSSIWTGRDTGELTDADILISELTGYFEKDTDNTEFRIDDNAIRETIHKGLFTRFC
jgi:predicted NACHT family NTPase